MIHRVVVVWGGGVFPHEYQEPEYHEYQNTVLVGGGGNVVTDGLLDTREKKKHMISETHGIKKKKKIRFL